MAEYGITVTLGVAGRVVQETVVLQIDEELTGCGMRVTGAGHRKCATRILQAVIGFIVNGRHRLLLFHIRHQSPALRHESRNHAMKNRADIVSAIHVGKEIGHGCWRLGGIQFDFNGAQTGRKGNVRIGRV